MNWISLKSCSDHAHFWKCLAFSSYEVPWALREKKTSRTELIGTAIRREMWKWFYAVTNGILRNFTAITHEQRCTQKLTSHSACPEKYLLSWSRRLCLMMGSSESQRPGSNLVCSYVNRQELHPLQWKPSGVMPEQLKLEACPKWVGAHYKTK